MPITRSAKEVAEFKNGRKASAEYFVNGKLVGRRYWHHNGQLQAEWCFSKKRIHGLWRQWHPNGQLSFQTRYKNGLEHGIARQWNERGEQIGSYQMKMGTGWDVWWGLSEEFPSETRYFLKGKPHGLEQWWRRKNEVWEECHWSDGKRHGIWRMWKSRKLDSGYPQFYLSDKKVTKRVYLMAAKKDATLPAYDPKDDSPRRTPPSLPLDRSRRLVRQVVKDAAHPRNAK